MKNLSTNPNLRFLIIAIYCLLIPACQEDDNDIPPSIIQFTVSLQNVTEGDETTVQLSLDKPASQDGSVEVSIETNAIYDQHFVTDPTLSNGSIVVTIQKGQKSVEFNVTTIDNVKFEGTKFLVFQLKNPGQGLRLGVKTTLTLTINDDEGPSIVNFEVNVGTVTEDNAHGIVIQLPLSTPTTDVGSITLTLNPGQAVYGTHFTTTPAATNNAITFTVEQNATGINLTVLPIDNDLYTGDFIVSFSISAVSGVVQKGNNLNYSLTIVDDELPSVASFAKISGEISETNSNGIIVEIPFSSPAKGNGSLIITLNADVAVYGKDFITSPIVLSNTITLNILPEETSASFTVFPTHNFVATQNQQITFSISDVSGVIQKGTSLIYSLTIINEDHEALVNFEVASGSLDENNGEGIVIEIPFSAQAPGEGNITISVAAFNAQNQFTTTPAVAGNNTITLNVANAQDKASFKVVPVNNTICTIGERYINFKITFANGSVMKGSQLDYKLTLVDDEVVSSISFTETEGSIAENNSNGIEVKLKFSNPAFENGVLHISSYCDWYGYDPRYTTTPPTSCDWSSGSYVSLNILKGDIDTKFTVFPVDNNVKENNFVWHFFQTWSGHNNCLQRASDSKFILTIVDDD
jgi:hypothetical protein